MKLAHYYMCVNCTKKVEMPETGKLVHCNNSQCKATMAKKKCQKAFYCKVQLQNHQKNKLHFTLFDNMISKIVDVYNFTENPDPPLIYRDLSEEQLQEIFAEIEEIELTYEGARVINIEPVTK